MISMRDLIQLFSDLDNNNLTSEQYETIIIRTFGNCDYYEGRISDELKLRYVNQKLNMNNY